MNAVLKRRSNRGAMLFGQLDCAFQQRSRVARGTCHSRATQESPENGERLLAVERRLEIELGELPRVRPGTVDDAEAGTGEAKAPAAALADAESNRVTPRRGGLVPPERHEQCCPWHT